MFENVLFLEKRGCNFWKDEPSTSDVKNYRVCTHGERVLGKDNRYYFIEFSLWRDRKQVRYTHKKTGKPLKHPAFDIINTNAVAIDTQYSDAEGSWRNCKLEEKLNAKNYSYTISDILAITNEIAKGTFNRVIFADKKAIDEVPSILKVAGFREKSILENLAEVERVQADANYLVYKYTSTDGYSFEYEVNSKRITG